MRHPYLAKFAILAVATLAVPVILSRALQVTGLGATELLAKTYFVLSPVLEPLLKFSGIVGTSPHVNGIYGVFLLFYLAALLGSLQGARLRLRQYSVLNTVLGAARQASQKRWFILLGLSVAGAASIALSPVIPVSSLETLLLNCGRLAAVLGLGAAVFVSAMFSWQHYILNKKAALESRDSKLEHPIYVAFVAELIHAIGTTSRIPMPYEMELTLSQLCELAEHSHSTEFGHDDLGDLCEKAITLFAHGELTTLPDLLAAKKLYYSIDPASFFDIATELQQRIESPEAAAKHPTRPVVPLIKDIDTSLA